MIRNVGAVIGAVCLHQLAAVSAGVCEKGRIPLRTVDLGNGSSVCVVPFCGETGVRETPDGIITCLTCDNSPWGANDYIAKSDVCPTALGTCDKGECCPKKGPDTWYHKNFGKDWNGIGTWPNVSITYYSGLTACGGTVAEAEAYLKSTGAGIDGIAAVPSVMYGSWPRNMKPGSQQCYVNNNVCYKVTSNRGVSQTVAVWGKCGGYTQCPGHPGTGLPDGFCSPIATETEPGAGCFDANQCINVEGTVISAGTTPDCKALYGGDGMDNHGTNCCTGYCQKHVDHCGSNDHVHIDVSETVHNQLCGDGSGKPADNCLAAKIEPVLCPWNPPTSPGFGDWTPKFAGLKEGSDPEAVSVHDPYPHPHCYEDDGGSAPAPEPTDAPVQPPPSGGPVDCDSVASANLPLGSSCNTTVCSFMCQRLKSHCSGANDEAFCINEAVQLALCPNSEDCGCTFA